MIGALDCDDPCDDGSDAPYSGPHCESCHDRPSADRRLSVVDMRSPYSGEVYPVAVCPDCRPVALRTAARLRAEWAAAVAAAE